MALAYSAAAEGSRRVAEGQRGLHNHGYPPPSKHYATKPHFPLLPCCVFCFCSYIHHCSSSAAVTSVKSFNKNGRWAGQEMESTPSVCTGVVAVRCSSAVRTEIVFLHKYCQGRDATLQSTAALLLLLVSILTRPHTHPQLTCNGSGIRQYRRVPRRSVCRFFARLLFSRCDRSCLREGCWVWWLTYAMFSPIYSLSGRCSPRTPVNTPQPYLDVARKLGNLLADGGHMTVNGAGRVRVFWLKAKASLSQF